MTEDKLWVGLTDDEIKDIVGRNDSGGIGAYTREMFKQIEDKLREKNRCTIDITKRVGRYVCLEM